MSYCQRSDLENVYGKVNVAKWADLDNNEDNAAITARIDAAIVSSVAKLDGWMRNKAYDVPFVAPLDPLVVEISARFAGIYLYEARGYANDDGEYMTEQREHAESLVAQVLNGRLQLTHERATNIPGVLTETTEASILSDLNNL